MRRPLGRIIAAVLLAEGGGVCVLVALVAIFGPHGAGDQAFAERLGAWVGPSTGFLFCLAGGFWVARRAGTQHASNGLLVGLIAAALDLSMGMALGARMGPLLLLSNVGRIVAGLAGGRLAERAPR